MNIKQHLIALHFSFELHILHNIAFRCNTRNNMLIEVHTDVPWEDNSKHNYSPSLLSPTSCDYLSFTKKYPNKKLHCKLDNEVIKSNRKLYLYDFCAARGHNTSVKVKTREKNPSA